MSKLWLAIMLCAGLMSVCLFTGCEDDDDEEAITGNSAMHFTNGSVVDVRVYFAGKFIGKVREGTSRQWSVPAGNSQVKAVNESTSIDVVKRNFLFYDGQTTYVAIN